MRMSLIALPYLLTGLTFYSSIQAAALNHRPSCKATSNWPGWAGVKHAFIFGDSYTTTGFNTSLTPPSATNPLGNPTYPGYTSSNGPNWVDYLTTTYNASTLLTYNLAYGGATIDSSLVAPYLPTVSSVAQQAQDEFFPTYVGKRAETAPNWKGSEALFAIFDGINDVGNSYSSEAAATEVLNGAIFAVYTGLVDSLYYAGARNFLFINVPPVDRSPLTQEAGTSAQEMEKSDIQAWNSALGDMAMNFKKEKTDANIFVVDANALFGEVLDDPKSYPQTSGYKNTTSYCVAYENGTPTMTTYNATCGIPVNEYFWLNSLHPTYPMQDVLAEVVSEQLKAGPNVC